MQNIFVNILVERVLRFLRFLICGERNEISPPVQSCQWRDTNYKLHKYVLAMCGGKYVCVSYVSGRSMC